MANTRVTRIRRSRQQEKVCLAGVARRTKSALLVSTALQAVTMMVLAVPAIAQPAPNARPAGGVVVGGTASISQTTNTTTIDQSSQRAALNWQSFNVGSAQSVTFQQPNARSIALNTVVGPNPSQIAGRINANGQIVLVNQSGVTFYKGSQVNTAGLMVSAAAADPRAFMRGGNIVFNQPGHPDARIINNGNITISGAGLASLVAPGVANAGVINATLGHVVLAGAKTATLDLYGDKLVSVNVTGAVTQAPDGNEALVTNTGVIKADGGTVRLTARAVDGVVTNLVTAGGTIQSRTRAGNRGQISIDGVGGSITITGDLDASGRAAGTAGGRIGLLASDAVNVTSGAVVDASGAARGGTIAIGTTLRRAQGGAAVTGARMAKSVVVQAGATIAANANTNGNGGRVTVLSSDTTTMSGLITARGGRSGGDGGFVEVSGGALSLLGGVDVTAPAGDLGTVLLDPTNLTVVGSNSNLDSSITGGGTLLASVADNPPDTVSTANLSGNILLQALQTLTVSSALSGTGSITLEAGGTINVNAGVSAVGDVILATGGAGPSGAPAAQASPLISVLASVSSSGGSVSMLSGPGGTIALGPSVVVLVTGNNKLATFQTDTLTAGTGVTVQNLVGAIEVAPASATAIHLGGSGGLSLTQAVLSTMTGLTLRLGGATVGGQVITTANAISVDGSINLSSVTPTLDLRSTGAVTQTAALTGGMKLTGTTGAVTLNNAGNGIITAGGYTVNSGGFTLAAANALGVSGNISAATGNVVLRSSGAASAINVAAAGALSAAAAGTVTAQAASFTNAGAVTGGTFEYAPNAPGVLTAGTGGNIASLAGVATANVRLGSANGSVIATGITTASNFNLGGRPLDLQAAGTVTDGGAFPFLNVSTLTGKVSGGSLALTANAAGIANVGNFTVSGGGFTLQQPTGTLSVSGNLTAPSVTLASGNLTIPGTISTGGPSTGSVSLTANAGTISGAGVIATGTLDGSASATVNLAGANNQIGTIAALTTGGLTVVDSTALTLAGNVSAGSAGTVDISTTGVASNLTQTGTLTAGVLTSTGGISGAAALQGPSNAIGTISGFTAAGSLAVSNGTAMTVAGVVGSSGGNVFVTTGAHALTFAPGGTLASKAGGRIGIKADGLVNLASAGASGVANAGAAGVFEFAPSTGSLPVTLGSASGPSLSTTTGITAGTLRIGAVTLPGNVVPTINTSAIAIAGTFNANGLALELDAAGGISQSAPLLNVATLSGMTNTGPVALGDAGNTVVSVGGFSVAGDFTLVVATDLSVTGVLSATSVALTAPGISVPGSITTGGATVGSVALIASATTIGGTGVITTGTLNGSAVTSIDLSGANQIGTLGSLTGGSISLNDGVPLAIGNTVSAAGAVALTSNGLLTVNPAATVTGSGVTLNGASLAIDGLATSAGTVDLIAASGLATVGSAATVAGSGVTLTGTSLAIDGLVTSVGTVDLIATAGSITEAGTLIADTLTGSASASASLTGAIAIVNQIANLGSFAAAGFTLNDGSALTVTGSVNGGSAVTIANTGLLTNNGTIAGTAISLTADNLALGGVVTDGGSGTVNLVARGNGTIDQTGILIAGVLSGGAGGAVTLTGASPAANQIGTIGPFSGGGILLNDGAPLTVASTVNGNAGTATLTTSGLLTIDGTVTAAEIGLTGSAIAIGGLVTDAGAGTVSLAATSGSIAETGSIIAGTLNGSAATSATLLGANSIANIGSFSAAAGTIALDDGVALAVTGTLSGPNGVSVADAGLMTISGRISSSAGNIILTDTSVNGIRIAGGSVIAAGNTVSVATDDFLITGLGTIVANTFEFGPSVNGGTVTLGDGFPSDGGIGATNIRIGEVNGTVTAGSIVVFNFDNGTRALELEATGTVSQAGPLTSVSNLTGAAASFELTAFGNTIGTLGGGTLAGGSLVAVGTAGVPGTLAVENAQGLRLAGLVSAGTVDLSTTSGGNVSQAAGATLIAGMLLSTNHISGSLNLGGVANQIGTINGVTAPAGIITVVDSVPLTLAGQVWAGTLDITTSNGAGVTQALPGTILAFDLTSSGGISGDIVLHGTGNLLGTISALTAAGISVVDNVPLTLEGKVSVGSSGTMEFSTNFPPFPPPATAITQGASGTLIAGVLTSASGIVGSVILQGTANRIGTISGVAITGGGLTVVNSQPLNLAGLVSVGSSGTVDISTSGGGNVTQSAAGTLIAGVLTSANGIAGNAILQGTANQIGTISGLTAAGLTVVDSPSLTLTGNVSVGAAGTADFSGPGVSQAAGGTLIAGVLTSTGGISGDLILRGTANAIGSIVDLTATGLTLVDSTPLTLAGKVSMGSAGTVDISGASVSQAAGDTLIAGVLTSANGLSGSEILQGTANQIGTITGLTTGGLVVVDSNALILAGNVSAGSSGTVDITTSGAGSNLTQTGTLIAGVLTSTGGIAGTAGLLGPSNAIGTISGFTSVGSLVVIDGSAMTVAGAVGSSAGNVFVTPGTNTLTFASGGTLVSKSGGTIGVEADHLGNLGTIGATGAVNTGTAGLFELAPVTTMTETLGAASGSGLSLTDLTGITTGTVRIGAVTLPGSVAPAVTAGSIAVAGTFNAASITTLDLEAKGTISQTAPIINLATLIASTNGVPGDIALGDTLNSIGTIASFSLSTGTISFGDTPLSGSYLVSSGQTILANNVSLTVIGTLRVDGGVIASGAAGNVTLTATGATGDLIVGGGALVQANGTVSLNAGRTISQTGGVINGGSVVEAAGALLSVGGLASAAAVSLTGANISISGEVTDGGAGTVALIATSGTINETGTLISGLLSGSSTGATELTGATAITNQVATLGDFTVVGAAGFHLNDGRNLSVAGTLNGVVGAFITDSGALSVGGTITSPDVSLIGASIAIPGLVTAGGGGSISLIAKNGTISETGTLIALGLAGSSTGATSLTGATAAANKIASIVDFTAAGFTLNDGTSLSVDGPLLGGSVVSITDSASISVPSSVSATAVSLTGTNITINGLLTDGGAGTVRLIATGGTINETGTLIAGTLSGGSTGATILAGTTATANQVSTVGGFTAAGFTLNDGRNLTVAGVINGGTAATISDSALLTVSGTVTAAAVSLTGANIALPGLVTDGGAGTVALIATGGTINETGTLIAGTLSGNSTGAASLTGATATTNQVSTITSFTAAGFTMNDGESLTVSGMLNGGTAATIADNALVSVTGTVTAAAISLTGAAIAIPGLVTDGGAGTVALIATGGTIDETGTLIAGTLSGSSTGATSLTGASATTNQIATLGTFSAASLTLNDGKSLGISGIVNGGTRATVTGSALVTVTGSLTATAINLTGTAIAIPGLVTDGGTGTVALIATGGTINEAGTLIAGKLSGGSTGATTLTGTSATTNRVAAIGTFTAAGFTLNDGKSLTVAGVLNGGTAATIADNALLTVAGTVTAASVSLTGANLALPGLVTDGGAGTVALIATGGTINESGTLIAGTLSGGSADATNLAGATAATNQVTTITSFTAAGFTLNDGKSLTVTGMLNGGSAATITDSALLTIGGTVSATAVALTGANVAIPGLVTDGGSGTVGLIATGGTINETGTLIAGALSGGSTGATTLTGATNLIATLRGFTAAGFTLNDGQNLMVNGVVNGGTAATIADSALLTVTGTVTAAAVSLTAANIAISGVVTDGGAGTVALIATGGTIHETGTLIAGTLSGSSTGATTLVGSNSISLLGDFTGSSFELLDNTALTVKGWVNGGTSTTIVDGNALSVLAGGTVSAFSGGTLTATTVSLTGTSVDIAGRVSDGGNGSVSVTANAGGITLAGSLSGGGVTLTAAGGGISETGTIVAASLTGSSTGATSLTGATPTANDVRVLANFNAKGGLTFNDGAPLDTVGLIDAGPAGTIRSSDTLTIDLGSKLTAQTLDLTAGEIVIAGVVSDGGAGTVRLTAGQIIETGTLIAGTLEGASAGSVGLDGASATANQIATLAITTPGGSFSAASLTINDGRDLTIAGVVNAGTSAAITSSGVLTVGGTLTATSVTLNAANIAIPGLVTDGGAGTVALIATTGTISEPGTLIAGTLSGRSFGATTLTGATATGNQVATLGTFTAAGFTMDDGENLTVSGVVNGGPSATIVNSASLTINGTVSATAVSLTGANIAISGLVTDGGSGTTGLIATGGTIFEIGTLIAGTLSGGSTGATTLSGATPAAKQVATIGTFTAAGFTMNDGASLTVSGVLNGGSAVTITDIALLTVAGTVSAATIALTAADIAIPGLVTDGGAGTVDLIATAGTINETGTLIAGMLSGGSTGATTLTGSNQVASIETFTAADFTLNDGTSLTVAGLVNGGASATITGDQALTIASGGSVNSTAIGLQGTSITILGAVTDGPPGTVNLVATSGTIGEAASGTVIAGTLSGSSTGATTLTSANNHVDTLGTFIAAGFVLNDGTNLSVNGLLNGGAAVTIVDSALLAVVGTVTAAAVSLTGANIAISGLVTDGGGGSVSLIATAGTIDEPGTLIAGTLSGGSTGAATFSGGTNRIATVTNFSADGLLLNDGIDLSLTGVIPSGGAFVLTDTGNLTIGEGASVTGTTVAMTGGGNVTIAGGVTSAGTGTINAAGTLAIPGTVNANKGVTIFSGGGMTVAGGIVSSAGAIGITGPGGLAIPGLISGQTGVAINDTGAMTVMGTVVSASGGVSITNAGPLTIPGLISGQTGVTITETGAMNVAGTILSGAGTVGVADIGTLNVEGIISGQSGVTQSATGDMNLSGLIVSGAGAVMITDAGVLSLINGNGATNSPNIGVTSSIVAATTIGITDLNTMSLGGLLSAPRIVVNNGAGSATFLPGTQIVTSGRTRPRGSLSVSQLPTSANPTDLGFFMTTGALLQTGTLTVTGTPSVMRIDASTSINLALSPAGIVAPDTWFILGETNGAKAAGFVVVLNLDAFFTGAGAGSTLTGTVGGLNGNAAAGASGIVPSTNSTFRINGCPIASVNCVLLTTQGIPAASPLRDFVIGSVFNPTDEDDLLLPLVSDEVY